MWGKRRDSARGRRMRENDFKLDDDDDTKKNIYIFRIMITIFHIIILTWIYFKLIFVFTCNR